MMPGDPDYIRTPHDDLVTRVARLEARIAALEYAALPMYIYYTDSGKYYERERFDPTKDYSKK
jgi:hypothetical protein